MIVALTGNNEHDGNHAVSDLAEELALLRVAAGNRVLLVCPEPCAYDPQLYDDLVIDASHNQARDAASLAGAAVIVALLRRADLEHQDHAALLARLREASAANPGARLLVTVAHGSEPLTPHQTGCLLVFVAQLPGARLADTLVLDHDTYHSHHSAFEADAYKTANVLCAPEVRHLYRQVFSGR
ncbi:hypothetical protein J2X54_002826 [Duganella sp. 3397]|uniref:Uncharacterized protein n=1 Tax=Duganella phyllosphaerae TaxID=762836 RepID=A0A1E7WC48_9BURK|nr:MULTISPECIES: hypothetical protein [Duganella]MDR7050345.1 hypothetical protein [Duganella sp. 3397]OEZ94572.1 hypothetical protein DUPY_45250 [Duganella phyllosphaerae]